MRQVRSDELESVELGMIRELCDLAWTDGRFTDHDWEHTLGGMHFLVQAEGEVLSHASVVSRELQVGSHRLNTGYVEAVATRPGHRRRGHASAVLREVGRYIDRNFQLGALDTGSPAFYQRLGWVIWQGPTLVRTDQGPQRTPNEDGNVLVRLTPTSPPLDLSAPIICDWREGDVW